MTKNWASAYEVKRGDLLEADGGFPCIAAGARLRIEGEETFPSLWVSCSAGRHYLSGNLKAEGELVGFRLVTLDKRKKRK